jgi:hypothetical protein
MFFVSEVEMAVRRRIYQAPPKELAFCFAGVATPLFARVGE